MSSKFDIDFGDPLSGVSKVSKDLVYAGLAMGWTARWGNSRKRVITLRSPDRAQSINVPTANLNYNRAESLIKQLTRHSDEKEIEEYLDSYPDGDVKARIRDTAFGPMAEIEVTHPEPTEERYVNAKGEEIPGDWWVRTYPDGTVEYVCKAHREEFVVDRKAQVAGHGKAHSPKVYRKDEESRNFYVEPAPVEPEVETRVSTPEPEGDLTGQIEALVQGHVRHLTEEIESLRLALAEALEEAEKAKGNLRAFRDLLQEVD